MQNKIDQLMSCYDSQARHFHHTRAFHKRPELSHIQTSIDESLTHIQDKWAEKLNLIDLGCGTWRIYERLSQAYTNNQIIYTWVDLSSGMITQCKKNYPDDQFIHQDMISYLGECGQQSVDIILCLASFHHLPTQQERLQFLHNAYRALSYGGKLIMVNRSFSERFQKKYAPAIQAAKWKHIYTLGTSSKYDILVPWIDWQTKQKYDRYYHIYTLQELTSLIWYTPFQIEHISYIDTDGNLDASMKTSRNSFSILIK